MKKFLRNLLAPGALCLLLCLAACAGTPEDAPEPGPPETLSGRVYVPEFARAETGADYVQSACISGGTVCLAGAVSREVEEINPETGEPYTYQIPSAALFQGGTEGGPYTRSADYYPEEFLEGAEGSVFSMGCFPGGEGTVWLSTCATPWNDQPSRHILQRFDRQGRELERIDLGALPVELSADDITGTLADPEGLLYMAAGDRVLVFDVGERPPLTLDGRGLTGRVPGEWNPLILLSDGRAAVRCAGSGDPGGTGDTLLSIDLEAGAWGDAYPLPKNCGGVWSGGGEFLFFCSSGDALYGYRTGEQQLDRLLSWTDVDINSDSLLALSVLEDGRLAAVVEESGAETVVLTPTDPASLPEKSTVSYATLGLRREVRSAIVAFNKAHPDCRVEVRDYSELNTAGDRTAGLTRLHTEILAGNVPDLLDTAGLPVRQYGRRGLLEDLLPYIRSDPDLGPEALMERVAEAAAQDGKLYQAFPSFTILTAAGRPELVGDRLRWTLADLAEAMKAMPEGGTALGAGREETLELLLPMLLDSFVDRDAGAASFDGEAFRALLEFCAACPAPEDGESPYTRTQERRQLLLPAELGTLEWEFILYPTAFGGKCSFVGYPREDGGAGSCFRLGDGVSMTAACRNKEAAWTFVRETFLPRYPTGTYFGSAYPINRADFDRMMAQAAAPELDENGQPAGAPSSFLILPDDSLTIPGRKPTREELEQFTALYDAVDQVYDPDEKLLSIVREGAGAYFAGDKSLADTVRLIQNRASLYLSENQ